MSHTHDLFQDRHIGPSAEDQATMLATLGFDSLDDFIDAVVPGDIRLKDALKIPAAKTEQEALEALRLLAAQNQVFRSYLGMGYHDCVTPTVIQRNVLENPGWYNAYTPYQAEIAQGRLEALLNFQTMVSDLTGLEIANASLLDEGTAAAEAMHLTEAVSQHEDGLSYLVDAGCHPQTHAALRRPRGGARDRDHRRRSRDVRLHARQGHRRARAVSGYRRRDSRSARRVRGRARRRRPSGSAPRASPRAPRAGPPPRGGGRPRARVVPPPPPGGRLRARRGGGAPPHAAGA